jgi:hypothetical protein
MNAVEIEEAISDLALEAFDQDEFPFAFLRAFGNKETTIKRLRAGTTNKSDLSGVLQTNNIHIAVADAGRVSHTLSALRQSPATTRSKARFILSTDGADFEAEDLETGETVACEYQKFPDHFGFFLPLAGISTVKQVRDSSFDIRATSRLNRLYVELLKDNPNWGGSEQRHEMNHFMARLIFCFFAEDTDIFKDERLFTGTVEQMSARDSSNTHDVISEIFRAMNTRTSNRQAESLPRWAEHFPYVNGGLFSGSVQVPRFSKISRSYLLHIGNLDWTQINPDIFGSMIQAVADDEERGSLGMHYTSVPNILKVLNPLFLDDLWEQLEEAGDSPRKLLNLRNRLARIRVFDPACGSGNFLVIAYKQMREIENTVNARRDEPGRKSDIPLTNFRGIELRDFSAEIARLALIIAEYQCDVLYRGQKEALRNFLPLGAENWITCGNALRVDWLSVCPPTGRRAGEQGEGLSPNQGSSTIIDFDNEGGETFICGNPPYKGGTEQSPEQKDDMKSIFDSTFPTWKSFDYILGFFQKARQFLNESEASFAFVATNSVCQGEQVFRYWPQCISDGVRISFAVTSFKWSNLASKNAGVTVCIVGLSRNARKILHFDGEQDIVRHVDNINAYLVPYDDVYVRNETKPQNGMAPVVNGNKPVDGGGLVFDRDTAEKLKQAEPDFAYVIRPYFGAHDATHGVGRYCIWADEREYQLLNAVPEFREQFSMVSQMRSRSTKPLTKKGAVTPYAFQQIRQSGEETVFQIPMHSSAGRRYYPVVALPRGAIISNGAFSFYDPPLWNIAIFASRLSVIWIGAVCGKIKTDFRFSNTLGWNTFPVPKLTEKNRADLASCAKNILLARELHFPATVADLYEPENMPENLLEAHKRNDEVLERIYIGRRFHNDTERLERLFDLYAKFISEQPSALKKRKVQAET